MTVEERLYQCFKRAFDSNNGRLRVELNCSDLIYDEAGYNCSSEFLEEMYQRWLSEGNVDKAPENKDKPMKFVFTVGGEDKEVSIDTLIEAIGATNSTLTFEQVAVVEQEDTLDSKSSAERHTGSTPVSDTTQKGEQDI